MEEPESSNEVFATSESRRSAMKKGAIGAAALWVVPTVLTRSAAAAASAPAAATNLAPAGVAAQSTTIFDGFASRANDGNSTDCAFGNGSVTHTDWEPHAWWEVDLGASHALSSLTVTSRCDNNTSLWVQNLDVYVDGVLKGTVPGTVGSWANASMALSGTGQVVRVVNNASGNFSQFGKPSSGGSYMSLTEVEVFGV